LNCSVNPKNKKRFYQQVDKNQKQDIEEKFSSHKMMKSQI